MVPLIEGRLRRALLDIVLANVPHEAVGIIYQEVVYELRNDHDFPIDNFAVDRTQLRRLTEKLEIPLAQVGEEVILWHSHPGGGIGPSTFDIHHKTPLKHHLVVALADNDLIPTWY